MEIVVVFRYSDIPDPDSDDADDAIENLTMDLDDAGLDCTSWHIDEVLGDIIDLDAKEDEHD